MVEVSMTVVSMMVMSMSTIVRLSPYALVTDAE